MSNATVKEIKDDAKEFNKAFQKLSENNKSYVLGYMNGVASKIEQQKNQKEGQA